MLALISFNAFRSVLDYLILLWLTSDDDTRQGETKEEEIQKRVKNEMYNV